MSQHDMTVDNGPGVVFRGDVNNALKALASQSSGAATPSPTFPCQLWADTGTGRIRQRNAANTAWIDKGPIDGEMAELDSPVFTTSVSVPSGTLSQHAVNAGQIQTQSLAAFTTAGTAPSFTLAPSPPITAYAAGQRFRVKFHTAGNGSDTINVSGRGAKGLKQYDSTGAKVAATIAAGQLTDVEYDGTDVVLLDPLPSDPWAMQPIGVPIPVFDHLTGASIPSTTAGYRYIKLTAADAHNTGVLTSESVTGSAPLVQATAVISLAGSPMNGQTVRLINTERRALRAGSAGTAENDQFQGHRFNYNAPVIGSFGGGSSNLSSNIPLNVTSDPISDGTNGTPRTGNETRAKNIGATYYMRIK